MRLRALQCFAALAALRDDLDDLDERKLRELRERAATLLGYLDARFSEHRLTRTYTEEIEYERTVAALGSTLGDVEFERLHDCGLRLDACPALD